MVALVIGPVRNRLAYDLPTLGPTNNCKLSSSYCYWTENPPPIQIQVSISMSVSISCTLCSYRKKMSWRPKAKRVHSTLQTSALSSKEEISITKNDILSIMHIWYIHMHSAYSTTFVLLFCFVPKRGMVRVRVFRVMVRVRDNQEPLLTPHSLPRTDLPCFLLLILTSCFKASPFKTKTRTR